MPLVLFRRVEALKVAQAIYSNIEILVKLYYLFSLKLCVIQKGLATLPFLNNPFDKYNLETCHNRACLESYPHHCSFTFLIVST